MTPEEGGRPALGAVTHRLPGSKSRDGGKAYSVDLFALTGQESGLVFYTEGSARTALICNWSAVTGLPRLLVGAVVGMGENVPAVTGEPLEALGEALDGVDVVDASSGVAADDLTGPATLYRVAEGVDVVAPAGWA